jgi:hypothetical protein
MESYNKKTNHDLLKELDKLTAKHNDLKSEIIEHYDIFISKEKELFELEKTYKEVVEILKNRM